MTVNVVYGASTDQYVTSYGATYATARNGAGTFFASAPGSEFLVFGQQLVSGEYGVTQAFLRWTFTALPGEMVTSAMIRLRSVSASGPGVSRDLEVRRFDWGAAVTSADFRDPAELASLPLLASAQGVQAAGTKSILAGSTALRDILAGGSATISVVALSSRARAGSVPTGEEQNVVSAAEVTGTASDPALIYYTAPLSTLHGVMGAQVRLSDGTWAVLESDGAPAPTVALRHHDGAVATTIATPLLTEGPGFHGLISGAQSLALAADPSDNLFLVGRRGGSANTLLVKAYPRTGGGWSTLADPKLVSLPAYSGQVNNVAASWLDTGGMGALLIAAGHVTDAAMVGSGGNEVGYAVADCASLRGYAPAFSGYNAATLGTILSPVASPSTTFATFANDTGHGLDVAGYGARAWIGSLSKGALPGEGHPVSIGSATVTTSGLSSPTYELTSAWGTKDSGARVRVVPIGPNAVALATADQDPGYGITIRFYQVAGGVWSALAPSARLDAEGITGMPASSVLSTSPVWDVVYVAHEHRLWVYVTGADRIVRRTSVDLTTYLPGRESIEVTTIGAAGGVNLALRAQRGAVSPDSLVTVAHQESGGAHVTAYVLDSFNVAPTEPTLSARPAFDATTEAAFAWTFSDPNGGDVQGARRVEIVNTGTDTIAYDSGKVATGSTSFTLPAGTLDNGAAYQWRVMTWDAADLPSPWSPPAAFSTSAGGAVAITDPAVDNPPDVITDDYLASWSVSGTAQATYRVWVTRNDTSAVVYDSGWVTSADTSHMVSGMVSDVEHTIRAQVRNAAAVESAIGSRLITPSFASPDAPTVTVENRGAAGYLLVLVDNPPPTGDRPAVVANEVYRREAGTESWTLLDTIAPGEECRDFAAAAWRTYEYKVRAVS